MRSHLYTRIKKISVIKSSYLCEVIFQIIPNPKTYIGMYWDVKIFKILSINTTWDAFKFGSRKFGDV